MNEELRQVKVVEFCEALTKRIRTAIAVLGGFAPGAKAEFHKLDNNVIRLQVTKVDKFEWHHKYTLDNGDVHTVDVVDMTEAEKYATEKFHNYVFQQNGLYHNGDIHFTKCEVDDHPAGMSTGVNSYLHMNLTSSLPKELFETVLTEKMRWYTQVHRKEWEPAKIIQQGFDQDKKLVGINVVPDDSNTIIWQFHWNDRTATIAHQRLINEQDCKLHYAATQLLLNCIHDAPWRLNYLNTP